MRNAQKLVQQKVDLAIEFQVYERIGSQLAAIYERASIPVIAIEIPQPGAIFFGIDNYRVGQLAGKALVKAAQQYWHGEIDELLMLDLEIAGSLPHLRISGAESAVRNSLPGSYQILHLDSRGEMERSFELVRHHMQFSPKRKTLICGVNDLAVLGALRAFSEVGRSNLMPCPWSGRLPRSSPRIALSANKDDRLHCHIPRTIRRQCDPDRARCPSPQTGPARGLCPHTTYHPPEHRAVLSRHFVCRCR